MEQGSGNGMSRVKAHIEAVCDLARRHGATVEST